MKKRILAALIAVMMAVAFTVPAFAIGTDRGGTRYPTPEGYNDNDYRKLVAFLETEDENGIKNGEKIRDVYWWTEYDPADPTTWYGVRWSDSDEIRLSELSFDRYEISGSLIGSLDVSGCESLSHLYCSGNKLTSLNLQGCTALSALSCESNTLTELDLSDCPAIYFDRLLSEGEGTVGLGGYSYGHTAFAAPKSGFHFVGWYSEDGTFVSDKKYLKKNVAEESGYTSFKAVFAEGEPQFICPPTPEGYNDNDYRKLVAFLEFERWDGVKNGDIISEYCQSSAGYDYTYDPENPETWGVCWGEDNRSFAGIVWDDDGSGERRVTAIGFPLDMNVCGELDASDCTALRFFNSWHCYVTGFDFSGCTSLEFFCNDSGSYTWLDLSGCTALREFHSECSFIESLDLSGLTGLEIFDCSGDHMVEGSVLRSIDVSGCTSLKIFAVSRHPFLNEIDLSDCAALEEFSAMRCDFPTIDLSDHTALTRVSIDICNVGKLDLSGCTALTGLEELWSVNKLNVSGCTSIRMIVCDGCSELNVDGCVSLSYLDCGFNLRRLDLSTCPLLPVNLVRASGSGSFWLGGDSNYGITAFAHPMEEAEFLGWYADGELVSEEKEVHIEGEVDELVAQFTLLYSPGDVNGDELLDVTDALLVLRYALGLMTDLPALESADVNGSGTVDMTDALIILRVALGMMSL